MNAELIQQKVFVLPNAKELADEYKTLVWESENGVIKKNASGARREHPGLPNHLCDASLYLWRYCYQYLFTKPELTKHIDWNKQEVWEPDHIQKLADQIQKEQNPNRLEHQLEIDEDLFDFSQDGM